MKLIFLSLLVAFGGLFKYGSMVEAWEACKRWMERGETIETVPKNPELLEPFIDKSVCSGEPECEKYSDRVSTYQEAAKRRNHVKTRKCYEEEETRQFLGYQIDQSKTRGKNFPEGYEFNWEVNKRFRY